MRKWYDNRISFFSWQQRQEISMKGTAKGRKRPTFHFWTKTKIKAYLQSRRKYKEFERKQMEAKKQIRNFNRGEHRHEWKWLPSEYEQAQLDKAEAQRKAEEAAAKKKAKEEQGDADEDEGNGGDQGDGAADAEDEDQDDGGGKTGPPEEPEEFMFPGMDDDEEF